MSVSIRFGGLAASATIALAGLVVAPAVADDTTEPTETVPCASEQAKVDKAEDALARVTAVFERQQAKVKKARKEVAQAEAGREKAEARKALREVKAKKNDTKVTKRAQQQRLAKAQERLAECEAEQPTEPTEPTPTA
ncbi:hypothetical protein GCM10011376_29130 [Nocardioides flavus (ex Wang et al. 2016)]|uniref:Uncharacterized protein n=1 Tax=Nocardioides flavus (ex Wang et al. 2016) TaxID=2058780 RepID=A0ABQ3HN31_9ACTN|nr:hypothetical protein [Nocardioides flavus (ex Wang et al. 2016)]GHE18303.1 hypothetical protein GCM10011376_29130 [Nocardioides flavus (ex Wang et al. 2016)]